MLKARSAAGSGWHLAYKGGEGPLQCDAPINTTWCASPCEFLRDIICVCSQLVHISCFFCLCPVAGERPLVKLLLLIIQ